MNQSVDDRESKPFDDAWLAEIRRRSEEYDAGAVQSISWAVVKEREGGETVNRFFDLIIR